MLLILDVDMCFEVFFYTNHPLLKALLIILPKRSVNESRQCSGRKRNSVKIRIEKPRGAPFLGAPGKYPLLSPPLLVGLVRGDKQLSVSVAASSCVVVFE